MDSKGKIVILVLYGLALPLLWTALESHLLWRFFGWSSFPEENEAKFYVWRSTQALVGLLSGIVLTGAIILLSKPSKFGGIYLTGAFLFSLVFVPLALGYDLEGVTAAMLLPDFWSFMLVTLVLPAWVAGRRDKQRLLGRANRARQR